MSATKDMMHDKFDEHKHNVSLPFVHLIFLGQIKIGVGCCRLRGVGILLLRLDANLGIPGILDQSRCAQGDSETLDAPVKYIEDNKEGQGAA